MSDPAASQMILARSKQILNESDDRALMNCLTLSFSYIMIAFLLFYSFCGCPAAQAKPSLVQDDKHGTDPEPLRENMKWSDIVFNWFRGSSADDVKAEDIILENVEMEEEQKDEKSSSIRALLKSYLSPTAEAETRSSGLASYFALAGPVEDNGESSGYKEIPGTLLRHF